MSGKSRITGAIPLGADTLRSINRLVGTAAIFASWTPFVIAGDAGTPATLSDTRYFYVDYASSSPL